MHCRFHFIHDELGLCDVRAPAWLPCRLRKQRIGYKLVDNAFVEIANWTRAQQIAGGWEMKRLHGKLDQFAQTDCPIHRALGVAYHWTVEQCEHATDIVFHRQTEFQSRFGRPLHRSLANTDSPDEDIESADFLRDRIWECCAEVLSYVRRFHPSVVFECLRPLDANLGKPAPEPAFRALNFPVNLPNEWKTSAYGVKCFRAEGFDYDFWQKNTGLMRQTLEFPLKLGRPASECMYLAGIYGPPDPPMREAYSMWRNMFQKWGLYSFCFWAFDQFCLNSRPVPWEMPAQSTATLATYRRPRARLNRPLLWPVRPSPAAA